MDTIHKSAWILIEDRKMLFLRSKGKEIFYLPGGKAEDGETPEAALIREIKEETGAELVPESLELVQRFSIAAHGRENTVMEVHGYYADYTGEITPTTEVEEIGWFDSNTENLVPSAGKRILGWLKEQNLID